MKKYSALVALGLLAGLFYPLMVASQTKDYPVPPPTISERKFPCMQCHDNWSTKTSKRQLKMNHADVVLKHDEKQRWCLDCHDAQNRNQLRLLNQDRIDFDRSYDLCGQCHGTIFRDWQAGVHGKRIGNWNGTKLYRLCVHCHDPHQPTYAPVKPEPKPLSPALIKAHTPSIGVR